MRDAAEQAVIAILLAVVLALLTVVASTGLLGPNAGGRRCWGRIMLFLFNLPVGLVRLPAHSSVI